LRIPAQGARPPRPRPPIPPLDRPPKRGSGWVLPEAAFDPEVQPRLQALFDESTRQIDAGRADLAEITLERCAKLSRYGADPVINRLAQLYKAREDIPALMALWKRVAVALLEQDRVDDFLRIIYISIYSEQMFSATPNYLYSEIDWDIHTYMRLLAGRLTLTPWVKANRVSAPLAGRRLRIGFVLEGLSRRQAPTRSYLPIAAVHDPARHHLFFYSRWSHEAPVAKKEDYDKTKAELEGRGCVVRHPAKPLSPSGEVDFLARQIVADQIDALVFQTIYFVPQHNLLANLRCAPFQAAVEHQQAEYHQAIDLVFTPSKLYLEATCSASPPLTTINKKPSEAKLRRSEFKIPPDALVLVSVNRGVRYAQPEFWREVGHLMLRHPHVYLLLVGLEAVGDALPLDHPARPRVITPGFRRDVMELLAISDIYVDLFPSGGGSSILEAMAEGLPSVAFYQDFARRYWLPEETVASIFVGDPDLLLQPEDYEGWQALMDRLILEPGWRAEKAASMRARIKLYEPPTLQARFFDVIERGWRRVVEG
ncbi:glycosyltransferase, partial [Myxococcota bacterium]|nr:glycosyltransferase [Myxococcota bacterium]MBU1897069.1 glycosyltransferase [Myxococcota bacterium]